MLRIVFCLNRRLEILWMNLVEHEREATTRRLLSMVRNIHIISPSSLFFRWSFHLLLVELSQHVNFGQTDSGGRHGIRCWLARTDWGVSEWYENVRPWETEDDFYRFKGVCAGLGRKQRRTCHRCITYDVRAGPAGCWVWFRGGWMIDKFVKSSQWDRLLFSWWPRYIINSSDCRGMIRSVLNNCTFFIQINQSSFLPIMSPNN